MENIGVRAVIEGLSGYMSGLKDMQQATTDQTKALGDLQKAGTDVTKSISSMTSPFTSTAGALEKLQAGTSDEARELASMTGAVEATKTPMARFQAGLDGIVDTVYRNKLALGAFGAAIVGSMGLMVKGAEEQRISQAKLSVALQNVGVSYSDVSKELEANMAATARKTGVSDEAQREALSRLIFVTGSYERSVAALPVVLDLAAARGIDASSAAQILGRAMSGSTEILKRYGIYVKEGASATEILAAVQASVKGSAEAMASPFTILKDQMGEMGETIGSVLLPPLKLFTTIGVTVVNVIQQFVEHSGLFGKALIYITGLLGLSILALVAYTMAVKKGIIQEVIAAASKIAHGIAQIALNVALALGINPALGFAAAVNAAIWPLTLIVGIIALVVAGIVLLIKHWNDVINFFGLTSPAAKEATGAINGFKNEISDLTTKLADQKTESDKLTSELQVLQDEYTYVQNNAAGYKDRIGELNTAIAAQEGKISSLGIKIEETTAKIKALEDATSAAYDELDKLSTPRLEGMQAYEDQIFGTTQALKELRLQELKQTGINNASLEGMQAYEDQIFAVDQELHKLELQELQQGVSPGLTLRIKTLEDQRKELELTRDIKFDPLIRTAELANDGLDKMRLGIEATNTELELTRDIKFDPLTRTAKEAVETLTGMNKEMAPAAVMARIQQLATEIANNNSQVVTLQKSLDGYNITMSTLQTGLIGLQNTLAGIMTIVNSKLEDLSEHILNIKNLIYLAGLKAAETQKIIDGLNVSMATTVAMLDKKATSETWLDKVSHFLSLGGLLPELHGAYGGTIKVGERGPEVVQLPVGSTVYPNNYNTTYNVNANYSRQQDPQSIGMDLEAIRMMSRA